jgi:hypothetical protein
MEFPSRRNRTWPVVHQSLHFAPARRVQRVAHNGMSLAEFQRVMDDDLVCYNKRRPHWLLEGLTPREEFYGPKPARSAKDVRFLPGLAIMSAFWRVGSSLTIWLVFVDVFPLCY